MQLNLEIQIQANGPVPAQDDKFYNRTQIYICSMKRYSLLIAALSSCAAFFSSCTDDDNKGIGTAEPGIYFVEKEIGPQTHAGEKLSRGIIDSNFDAAYDPDVIYLHNMSSGEKVGIPVYACEDCPNSGKGFRYRLEVKEDGSAVLTPINEDGTYSENSLTIGSSESCYFSSWESDEWKLQDVQIEEIPINDASSYTWYRRKNDVNKEIYRSVDNFTVDGLANLISVAEPLHVSRACAGFNVLGLFYDGEEAAEGGRFTELTADEFESVMGSDPSEWYIKIFIGGEDFLDGYNISTERPTGGNGGYYSTNDVNWFESGNEDKNEFLQFSLCTYSTRNQMYDGFGYYTKSGNHLITPVANEEPVEVYVLIKHWTGAGEPDEEWLSDNSNALMTKVNTKMITQNGLFYDVGLMMDIRLFKQAWENAGGDATMAAAKATRSTMGIREFTVKDAIVICEAY